MPRLFRLLSQAMRLFLLCLLIALAAAGCGPTLDPDRLDICRSVMPALHPDGTELREIRVAPASLLSGAAVRIDYAAREPEAVRRTHFVICGFERSPHPASVKDLSAVVTEAGEMGEARLYYLKRFWLDPRRQGAVPVPPTGLALNASTAYAAQQAINAIALCSIYSLLATAYSLIYGLVGRINLAFGEIAVIGAYGAIAGVTVAATVGIADPLAGIAIALVCATLLSASWSWLVGRLVVAPLQQRSGQPILVATIAVALAITEMLRITQDARDRWLPPVFHGPLVLAHAEDFAVTVTPAQLCISAIAFAATTCLLLALGRTGLGRRWRAYADDPLAARMFGVSPQALLAVTFALAGANAGLAGWIVAVYYGNVSFSIGLMLSLKALLAALIGGIGRIEGALIGGVAIGLVEAGWSAYFDMTYRDIVVFVLLIALFVIRPGGLLGLSGPRPREM